MDELLEYMCIQCGISVHLPADIISVDEQGNDRGKLLNNVFCAECGGPLMFLGKAGDEPLYRLQ